MSNRKEKIEVIEHDKEGFAVKYKFDSFSLWNLDVTLAKLLRDALSQFAELIDSYPERYGSAEAFQNRIQEIARGFGEYVDTPHAAVYVDGREEGLSKGLQGLSEVFEMLWH